LRISSLPQVTTLLVDRFQPEQVLLFGSHAWGTPDQYSDVDLMVIISHSSKHSMT
jgi:predicted nucleotidyltransferase